MSHHHSPDFVITVKDRPAPEPADDYYDINEVIYKSGPPPKGYCISNDLEIITRKDTDESINVDPNLLYQCPDVEKFYPGGIRSAFGMPLNMLLNGGPMTAQDRRRLELSLVINEFRRKYRLIFAIIAIFAMIDLLVTGYGLALGTKSYVLIQVFLIITSFSQFMVSNDQSDDLSLFELMVTTPSFEIQPIIGRKLIPIMSFISIEIALLIFTCVQRHVTSTPISLDVIILTVTLSIKVFLLIIILFKSRQLRNDFDRTINQPV